MKTIDITPTWEAVLPLLLAAFEDGTPEGRRMAREELRRMASIADLAAKLEKKQLAETAE